MDPKPLYKLEGSVESVVYRNEDNGFTVLLLDDSEQITTVVGEFSDIQVGEQLIVTGIYSTHPKYGYQLKAQMSERSLPATANAIFNYLSSGALKGVGRVIARRLVDAFGDDTLTVIEKTPEKLSGVKGISPKKAAEIATEYQKLFGIRTVMLYLSAFGIPPTLAIRTWKLWKMATRDMIENNPFSLCCEEIGLNFELADRIAVQLGMTFDNTDRIKAGICYVLRHNLSNGHVCLPWDKLIATAKILLEVETDLIENALSEQVEEGILQVLEADGGSFVYLPELYEAEGYIAAKLTLMLKNNAGMKQDCSAAIDRLEQEGGLSYAKLQRKAIETALRDKVMILTGGPGTGKTTAINAILTLFEETGIKTALAAPTGRAAKRMSEVTGREAKTIHRLLEVDFSETRGKHSFKRGEKNLLPQTAIIIDEMSMVDTLLFDSLLRAVGMNCKLVLVGDPDQLPSVGAGNVLRDLIASDMIPVVHLCEIFRQAAQSMIVTNAHRIVSGECPVLSVRDNDFFFLQGKNSELCAQTVSDLCAVRLPKTYGFSPLWDIQVIAPTKKGLLGTVQLNQMLQDRLNPKDPVKKEFGAQGMVFREGDKVMQIKNNYDILWKRDDGEEGMGIFNGDIGIIELIDRPSSSILVRYEDRVAEYAFDMADELELAYAVTVHKSQGSEFEAVVIPLSAFGARMHYRNLLYTAVTRARRILIIVGDPATVSHMVANHKTTLRYTNLGKRLGEMMID